MMKAFDVHYNLATGRVTATEPGDWKTTVTEDCTGVELIAGDDIHVRVDEQLLHVEALGREPLLVRLTADGQLKILTARRPEYDAALEKD